MKIYKYTLAICDYQLIQLPEDAMVISVCEQYGNIVVYAIVNSQTYKTDEFEFRIHGTGHLLECLDGWSFLGTIKLAGGTLIFHVFFKKNVFLKI